MNGARTAPNAAQSKRKTPCLTGPHATPLATMMKIALSFISLLLSLSAASAADPIMLPPMPVLKPIFFAAGGKSGTVGGHVLRGERNLYSLIADAGQLLTVSITTPDNNAVFQIYEPGTKIERGADGALQFTAKALHAAGSAEDTTRWVGRLPSRGTYIIVIGSTRGNASYSMDVKIE
jgi:hypothetical protein